MGKNNDGNSGILDIKELQNRLLKTKQFKYAKVIDAYLLEGIKSGDINMPANNFLANGLSAEYRADLIDLYDRTFAMFDHINDIPEAVKVSQGALLDSVHYGYDMEKGTYELYTMNPWLFNPSMTYLDEKLLSSIFKKNLTGDLKCLKVDVEYVQTGKTESSITYKLINHRKVIDDESYVILVPILAGIRICNAVFQYLSQGLTLKVTQMLGSTPKVRCISLNQKLLKHYCDTPEMTDALTAQFYPYKGFFYAPVLGAPSTTAMVTNVNIFDLSEIKKIDSLKEIQDLGVQKPKDALNSLVYDNVISGQLLFLKSNDPEKYDRVLDSLPNFKQYLSSLDESEVTQRVILNYIHSAKQGEVTAMIKAIPNCKKHFDRIRSLYKEPVKVEFTSSESLKNLLKTHIVRAIIKKADFTLSSMTVTNNPEILKSVYGDNYVGMYEGFSVRARAAIQQVTTVNRHGISFNLEDVDNVFNYYGFTAEETEVFVEQVESNKDLPFTTVDDYEDMLYHSLGKKQTASKSSDAIMVRTLNAYIEKNRVVDYYRYLDPNKIVSIYMLS